MRRRMRTPLTVTTAAALALSLGALPAGADEPPAPTSPSTALDEDRASVAQAVADAVAEAERQAEGRTFTAPSEAKDGGAAVTDALDQALADTVAGVPIGVVGRVDAPGLRWSGSDGTRRLDGRGPARPQDRFRAASNTKMMVSTLVLQEVEKGTWTLDTPVVDLVPESAAVIPDAYEGQVTLELLLTHRSGLPDHLSALTAGRMADPEDFDEFFEVLGEEYTTADHLAAMDDQPWLFEPGTGASYSNAGYVLLGLALEHATGQSVERLLEKRVFKPAGMRHSAFPDDPGYRGPFLHEAAYTADLGAGWYALDGFDPSLFGSAGAVTSTTADLQRFTEALVTGDLLEAETVTDVLTPRTVGSETLPDYGLGVYRLPDPCQEGEWLYGHDGASFGTLSITLTSPDAERQVTVALTGRDLTKLESDLNTALVPALLATC
ncbi:serine hydrolase domain-containing protein [Krasilnikoviella flava]|uniref:D-alanyl-D-alanine carboxypeptidase n=1 Tax=Krasilnikoviella flava TaxID=526729 RepID=A0A1T5LZ92_9MICO|nr:serine hydrolase domain-containing protein [Krasilnikoviella flava]SKC81193.1 D-alanyl-D-alanine carboxypeptidase [Krasilnikoviella flava]